jgi:modulator of FtsH protease
VNWPSKPTLRRQLVANFPVASYSTLAWHDFFLGTIGASAALTGLLFVAISINLEQILKYPQLPGRAAGTLGVLVSTLVVSGLALAPGQSIRALGIEIAAAGAVVAGQSVWVSHGSQAPGDRRSWQFEHLATLLLPSLAFIVGGVSLIAGGGGGFYWVLAAILIGFVSASINAWVLLVEIKR